MKDYFAKKEIKEKFIEEMTAISVWSGHSYAPEYFMELASNLETVVDHKIVSAEEYNTMIEKVYENDKFTRQEKATIAESLSNEFISLLKKEIDKL